MTTTPKTARLFLAMLVAFVFAASATAGLITNVTLLDFSAQYASGADQRRATNVINGSGLFGDAHTYYPPGTMWLSTATAGSLPGTNYITFDLGAVRNVGLMRVWNYNEIVSGANVLVRRGIGRADISTAGADLIFTTNFNNAIFNAAPGLFTNNFAQAFDFGGMAVRYIRFNIRTNHGELGVDPGVGLSKVLFYETNVPPAVLTATRNWSSNRVAVTFGESVTAATAASATNYSILLDGTNAATIQSAAMAAFNNKVYLQTDVLDGSKPYVLEVRNVRAAADNQAIVTNRIPITPELSLWLKADAGVTSDGSGFVSRWADQSGNGNDAVQPDVPSQPSLLPNSTLNNMPVVHFDGITNYMEAAHSPSLVIRHDYSFFTVVMVDDLVNFNAIMGKTSGNAPAPIDLYILNNSGTVRAYRANPAGNNGGNGLLSSSQSVVAGVPVVIGCVMNGTNATMYYNGPVKGSATLVAGVLDAAKPLRIGSRDDFATKMKGSIAEIMMFRGAVSDVERGNITDYLGAKYGITVTNLIITQQPMDITVLEGETASFSVAVSASSAVSYQWQSNGVNIVNATNASYTTAILAQSNNNTTYRVQVSVSGSSLLSDPAILSVIPDTVAPTVTSAGRKIWNPSEIVVAFSESMSPATTTNVADYMLDNGAAVTSVTLGDAPNKYVLTTTGVTNLGNYTLTIQNAQDLFSNVVAMVQMPLTYYPAPLALWLRSDVGVMDDGTGFSTEWDDQSGNFNNAYQFNGALYEPQIITNALNGLPVLRFDGTNTYLAAGSAPSVEITGDMSVFVVASIADYANFNGMIGKTTVNQPAPYDFYLLQGGGQPRLLRGNGTVNASVAGIAAPSLGVPHLISVSMRTNFVAHYLDGNPNGTGALNTTIADRGDALGIGTRSDLLTKLKGDMAELMIFGTAPSDADRMSLENYLATKYALFLGMPPRITLTSTSASMALLSWPTPGVSFLLESTTNLASPVWAPVMDTVNTSGGTNSVAVNISGVQQYFRLRKQ